MADVKWRAKGDEEVSWRQGVVILLKEVGLGGRRVRDVGREEIFRRTLWRIPEVGDRTRNLLQVP